MPLANNKRKDEARSGLLIAGCQPGCGKTVVVTGLAGTLREEGFQVRAVKPVCLGARQSMEPELAFLSSISQTPLTYPVRYVETPESLNAFLWNETIRVASAGVEPVLIELPGSCATPLRADGPNGRWLDVGDLARELGLPCLLVAREGVDAMEQLILNATYLMAASLVSVIGLVTVETAPEPDSDRRCSPGKTVSGKMSAEERSLALTERTGVPYLGCLKFSPSISVPRVSQGNLIKTTSAGIDLLPIIKTLNMRISV